ncbi:hypothetical protein Salat_1139700 [Sesamum alatum]|uniref:Uncharacterized protein n=1 Tax=Sesamum alatum TaxID=300844 RepID=A0AAE1YEG8_9LAMI|nr:hypothetical protein Salat_1139700 [Sesamum alatum]
MIVRLGVLPDFTENWILKNGLPLGSPGMAKVSHLPALGSNHSPLVLDTKHDHHTRTTSMDHWVWRFEVMWLRADDCEKVVFDAWSSGLGADHTDILLGNFEHCLLGFINYSATSFVHIQKEMRHLEKRLNNFRVLQPSGRPLPRLGSTQLRLRDV